LRLGGGGGGGGSLLLFTFFSISQKREKKGVDFERFGGKKGGTRTLKPPYIKREKKTTFLTEKRNAKRRREDT